MISDPSDEEKQEVKKEAPYGAYPSSVYPGDARGESAIRRNLSIFRRHLVPAASVFIIVASLGVLRAYRATPIYEAASKVLVERQTPRITKFEDVTQPGYATWGNEFYKTQEGLISSHVVLDIALQQPGMKELFPPLPAGLATPARGWAAMKYNIKALLGKAPTSPPEAWERLRGCISAKSIPESCFIVLRSQSSDPQRAAAIVNNVAQAYVRYHLLHRFEISNDAFTFLQEQKQKEEKALSESERKLQSFRETSSISSLDAADKEHPILRRLSMLNEQLTQKQLLRIDVESQCRAIEQTATGKDPLLSKKNEYIFSLPIMAQSPGIDNLRSSLVAAETEMASLQDIYGPEHPRLQAASTQVDLLSGKLRDSLKNVVLALNTQRKMLQEEEDELLRQYNGQNDRALDLAKDALTFQRLSNEVERHRKLFEVLVERMSEVQLTSDYTRTNIQVVEEASVPKAPIKPNKPQMVFMALLLGLALSIGTAFGLEHLDDTLRTPEDLEKSLGIPVLGFVPEIKVKKDVEHKTTFRALVTALEPNSSAVEAYRHIRASLFFSAPIEESKVLLITSGGPGDGKTTTACNLAITIAQSGKKVLLVDADFRRPQIHKIFGLDNTIGFTNVLVGDKTLEEAIKKTPHDLHIIENLDVICSGPSSPNPTELFESASMKKFMALIRARYDRIIIDTPPVLFVSDTSILSRLADGVILMAKSAERKRAHAQRACHQLRKLGGRVIGGILNNVKTHQLSHYYSDYYYYGYSRYHHDYYSSYYPDKDKKKKKKKDKPLHTADKT